MTANPALTPTAVPSARPHSAASVKQRGPFNNRGAGQLRLPGRGALQPVLLSGDPHNGDSQAAEAAEAYGSDGYYDDLPSPRWRNKLVKVVAVLAWAGLVGAVFTRGIFPMLPPLMKAEYGPSKSTPNFDNAQPGNSTKAIASAGSTEKFASRWLGDVQKQLKTASISNSVPPRNDLGPGATVSLPTPLWRPSSRVKKNSHGQNSLRWVSANR